MNENTQAAEPTSDELVARRSADVDKTASDKHVKVFVIPGADTARPTKSNYDHAANIAATRQYMTSQGLRPTGDVEFISAKPFGPKGLSWALTYACPAAPAELFDFQPVGVLDQQEDESAGDDLPTEADTREAIDAYGAARGIDTTGAANKAEAIALLSQPTD